MSVEPQGKTAPDRLPKAIGPYLIRERIGRGGMGVVYRAFDEKTKTEIALKVMASELDGDPETSERFFREAHVAGRLRHRNLVTVLESGEEGGRLYIAMELLTGTTLAAALKDSSALDLEEAAWMEGAGRVRTLIKVFLPLAVPAMVVTAIFTFINAWNEFAIALTLLRSQDSYTLPIQIFSLVSGRYTVEWHHVMAATFTATVPVAIAFAWLQRYLVRGLALGAVK